MKQSKTYAYWSLGFLSFFIIQDIFNLKIPAFETLQQHPTYRMVTGFIMLAYLVFMWQLSLLRIRGQLKKATKFYRWHKTMGAIAPLFFYIHTTHFGFAYLFFLSLVYFANLVLGTLNQEVLGIHKKWFTYTWMILHVTLSVLVLFMVAYHIVIVFTYH